MRLAGDVVLPSLIPSELAGVGEDIFRKSTLKDTGMTIEQLRQRERERNFRELLEGIRENMPRRSEAGADDAYDTGFLVAQLNPTYPVGDPRYGQPMQMDGQPMSMSTGEYGWMQRMNRLKETNPPAYQKVKGMMGPFGWENPPAGFQIPAGL